MAPVKSGIENQELQARLEYQTRLNRLHKLLHEAQSFVQVLPEVEKEMLAVLEAERLTIYQRGRHDREIVSKYMTGDELQEIRLPLGLSSIAGYVALSRESVLIQDVYQPEHLTRIHPSLKFNQSFDQLSGLRTCSMLAVPIQFKQALLGVLQVINKSTSPHFSQKDLEHAQELAQVMGQKFHYELQATQGRFDYLLQRKTLTLGQLDEIKQKAKQKGLSTASLLISELKIPPEEVGQSLEHYYQVPFYRFDPQLKPPAQLMQHLNLAYLKKSLWMPISGDKDQAVILISDPNDQNTVMEIQQALGARSYAFRVGLREDILAYLEGSKYEAQADQDDVGMNALVDRLEKESKIQEEQDISESGTLVDENESTIIQLVNRLIAQAVRQNASDIHIEPGPGQEEALVRMRVDGVCQEVLKIPATHIRAMIARIKIMSRLDISERRKPQDGKIAARLQGQPIELRVATLPTVHGESAVLRVLSSAQALPFQDLNLSRQKQQDILRLISRPHGIFLVTGPTGSGKTTTLHALLGQINSRERKIWTAEDPVEITQKGLQQVQVNPKIGFDFAAALRSFLRADPDVILIGEMRDKETARIAVEASLTGHLVFSTLHTNSAPETITRLLGLGLDCMDFAEALLGVLAQRLVRTLCPQCKKAYKPQDKELGQLANLFGDHAELQELTRGCSELYQPVGCEKCASLGYKGRTGIHELLLASPEIKSLIVQNSKTAELRDQALKQGMKTLVQDGIAKILQGQIDLQQLRLVSAEQSAELP